MLGPGCRCALDGEMGKRPNFMRARFLSEPEVALDLHLEPEVGGCSEGCRQPQRHRGCNARVPVENSRKMRSRDAQATRSFADSHFSKIIAQDLSGVCWVEDHTSPINDSPGTPRESRLPRQKQTTIASCRLWPQTSGLAGPPSMHASRCQERSYLRLGWRR